MNNLKYTTANYTVTIEFPKSLQEVFNAITNDLAKWWPEKVTGEANKLNDEFICTTGESHYSKSKVVEFVPNKKVVWLVTESIRKTDGFNWTGTKMIFELAPQGRYTILRYTYNGPVLENEAERLIQICDLCIKKKLYSLLTRDK